jgi:protein-L-isoaspartate O-methyltransferase
LPHGRADGSDEGGGVEDERAPAAIASVPRSECVRAERADVANVDTPIPIPPEQVTAS